MIQTDIKSTKAKNGIRITQTLFEYVFSIRLFGCSASLLYILSVNVSVALSATRLKSRFSDVACSEFQVRTRCILSDKSCVFVVGVAAAAAVSSAVRRVSTAMIPVPGYGHLRVRSSWQQVSVLTPPPPMWPPPNRC